MIRKSDQVNGNASSPGTQSFGQKFRQPLVEVILKFLEVVQLACQFSQYSGSRGSSLKVLACLVDGDAQGGSKDQNVENVINLNIGSTGLQRELTENLYGKFVHIVGFQAIIKLVSHGDSPYIGLA